MYEIVEHVCDLPYLALVALFLHLPKDTAALYRDCHLPEIRDLARRRQWLELSVRVSANRGTGYYNREDLEKKARAGIPLPYHVHTLLFLLYDWTPPLWNKWANYLEQADNIAVEMMHINRSYQHFEELRGFNFNLTSLTIHDGLRSYAQSRSLSRLALPDTLRRLAISDWSYRGSYGELQLSESLRELLLVYQFTTPCELPRLPTRLRQLELTYLTAVQVDEFVPALPRNLAVLFLRWGDGCHCAVVLELAVKRLPLLVYHHNLIVDRDLESYLYMHPGEGGVWKHVVHEDYDYAKYKPRQPITQLYVTMEKVDPPNDYLMHLLRKHPELEGLSFRDVNVGSHGSLHSLAPSLQSVSAVDCSGIAGASMQFAVNVTSLCLERCSLRIVPEFIRQCIQLLSLDLRENAICVPELDGGEFPRTLTLLVMSDNSGKATKMLDGVDLSHTLLEVLNLRNCGIVHLDKLIFPDSLRELLVSHNPLDDTVFGSVRLPPRLNKLSLQLTRITNPWLLMIPGSLRELGLGYLTLVDPPVQRWLDREQIMRRFRGLFLQRKKRGEPAEGSPFPPFLEVLHMQGSGERDFANYRFPPTLKKLDLGQSPHRAVKNLAVPPGCDVLM